MYTISNIVSDIARGCAANNMVEDKFSYRIIFYLNEGGTGTKHYIDTEYGDLRKSLEYIIRNNLTVTNFLVIAAVTVLKNRECVSLLSRSYGFNLNEYFQWVCGNKRRNNTYDRYAVRQKAV